MNTPNKCKINFIFVPIAQRDVDFYIATAKLIRTSDKSANIAFCSLYQPGNSQIESAGFKNFDIYSEIKNPIQINIDQAERDFKIEDLKALCLHEQLTFSIDNIEQVSSKFVRYLYAAENLLACVEREMGPGQFVLSQELAGFVGPLALHFAALKRTWKSLFSEPAFFKGRIHLNDGLQSASFHPDFNGSQEVIDAVQRYIQTAKSAKTVVAAKKDAHHFQDMGILKIFNFRNFNKLFLKIWNKYILRRQQEFDHIWNHSKRYLSMLWNRWQNSSRYLSSIEGLPANKKLLYFPFHVQLDFSLTIRSPKFLDQLQVVDRICSQLPTNWILIAKEHPASIGCLDQKRLNQIFQRHSNFYLCHPKMNSHMLIENSHAVMTINSKVGAEALMYEKPVFSLGRAFYTHRNFTKQLDQSIDLKSLLSSELKCFTDHESWTSFLAWVWQSSWPVELYSLEPQNVLAFTNAHFDRLKWPVQKDQTANLQL